MFSRIYITVFYVLCTLFIFAAATSTTMTVTITAPDGGASVDPSTICTVQPPGRRHIQCESCGNGVQCCGTVTRADDPAAAAILALLGIVVQGNDVLVGLTCSPISDTDAGGVSCLGTAVCCQDNSHGGLISIGCVPIAP